MEQILPLPEGTNLLTFLLILGFAFPNHERINFWVLIENKTKNPQ